MDGKGWVLHFEPGFLEVIGRACYQIEYSPMQRLMLPARMVLSFLAPHASSSSYDDDRVFFWNAVVTLQAEAHVDRVRSLLLRGVFLFGQ